MSILTDVFFGNNAIRWNETFNEKNVPHNHREFSRLGYDPRYITSLREKIAQSRDEDERIRLAATAAHGRSSGRLLGQPICIEYTPRSDDGYDFPERSALAWLKENGGKVGVALRQKDG